MVLHPTACAMKILKKTRPRLKYFDEKFIEKIPTDFFRLVVCWSPEVVLSPEPRVRSVPRLSGLSGPVTTLRSISKVGLIPWSYQTEVFFWPSPKSKTRGFFCGHWTEWSLNLELFVKTFFSRKTPMFLRFPPFTWFLTPNWHMVGPYPYPLYEVAEVFKTKLIQADLCIFHTPLRSSKKFGTRNRVGQCF